ncbi:hemerythrin family protein [bacterium]|nr:hemerythrin family protein [bacterium]
MTFIQWNKSYSVNIKEIDDQHQALFVMVNTFHENLKHADLSAPKKLLIELMEYTLTHFRTEEKYFKQFHYPDEKAHIREHQAFEQKIHEFRVNYQSKKAFNSTTVMNFIKDWIVQHILITDKKYMKCFHENGLK